MVYAMFFLPYWCWWGAFFNQKRGGGRRERSRLPGTRFPTARWPRGGGTSPPLRSSLTYEKRTSQIITKHCPTSGEALATGTAWKGLWLIRHHQRTMKKAGQCQKVRPTTTAPLISRALFPANFMLKITKTKSDQLVRKGEKPSSHGIENPHLSLAANDEYVLRISLSLRCAAPAAAALFSARATRREFRRRLLAPVSRIHPAAPLGRGEAPQQ